jgi:hypothetical protein
MNRRRFALLAALMLAAPVAACGDDDPKLKVTDITPDKGDTEGGTYIVIKGNRFIKDGPRNAKVYFGSKQGSVIRWQSDSELIVQSPPGFKDGEVVDIRVIFDPGGEIKIPKAFRFVEKGNESPNIKDLDTSKPKK